MKCVHTIFFDIRGNLEISVFELSTVGCIYYFFGYKTEVFSFPNNPKNLDSSYKMDLGLWDCLERIKLVL